MPSSLSLLDDPTSHGATETGCAESSRRSVILLSSHSGKACTSKSVTYLAYQLQLARYERDDPIDFRVLTRRCAEGGIELGRWSAGGTTSSVFLAGASFQFDLLEGSTGERPTCDIV